MRVSPTAKLGSEAEGRTTPTAPPPDIAGQDRINPTATLLSAVMMLEWLNLGDDATRLDRAITGVYAEERALTVDQGGTATTGEFANAVVDLLS